MLIGVAYNNQLRSKPILQTNEGSRIHNKHLFCFINIISKPQKSVNFGTILTMIFFCFRFGGTEAATFCSLTTFCKELESFNSFDVYQVAKLYHNKRPGIWKSSVSPELFWKIIQGFC